MDAKKNENANKAFLSCDRAISSCLYSYLFISPRDGLETLITKNFTFCIITTIFLSGSSSEETPSQHHNKFPKYLRWVQRLKIKKKKKSLKVNQEQVRLVVSTLITRVCVCSRHSAQSRCSPLFSFSAASTKLVFHSTRHIRAGLF